MFKGGYILKDGEHIPCEITGQLELIKSSFDYKVEQIKELRNKIKELEDSKGITELKNQIDDIRRKALYISLSDKELKEYDDFVKEHYEKCRGNVRIIIEGTGIGDIVKCQCKQCEEIKDITDISHW